MPPHMVKATSDIDDIKIGKHIASFWIEENNAFKWYVCSGQYRAQWTELLLL